MDANTWQPAVAPNPPAMGWMTGSGNISYLIGTSPTLADWFYNTTNSYCTGASLTNNPTPGTYATTPALNLSSYTAPASGTVGSPGLAALITNGSTRTTPYIEYPYSLIVYDNENQNSTPAVEQANPPLYMQKFVSACHSNGYNVCLSPGYDLYTPAKAMYPLEPQDDDLQWKWFVRVIVGMGGSALTTGDIFVLQNESQQNTSIFEELWVATAATLATISPAATVLADVSSQNATGSTNEQLGLNMATNAVTLTSPWPGGFYVATPGTQQSAGFYFFQQMQANGYSS